MQAFSESLNRGRFETWTKKPEISIVHAHQVHGTDIVSLETLPCEADGLMVSWDEFNAPLAIKTADCMPIVIEGEKGVIFLHAGWKGLADGILKKPEVTVIQPQRAFIGPSIHSCCFEVSEDFRSHFPDSPHFSNREGKLYFDLNQEARAQLRISVPQLQVGIAPSCTKCNLEFHSHRRDKTKERNWNLYIKG